MDLFASMLVHIEFRIYLFYCTSHLHLGPSDPFSLISSFSSRLCLGSQSLKVSRCLELGAYTLEIF